MTLFLSQDHNSTLQMNKVIPLISHLPKGLFNHLRLLIKEKENATHALGNTFPKTSIINKGVF